MFVEKSRKQLKVEVNRYEGIWGDCKKSDFFITLKTVFTIIFMEGGFSKKPMVHCTVHYTTGSRGSCQYTGWYLENQQLRPRGLGTKDQQCSLPQYE